jgi:hypothetical protein
MPDISKSVTAKNVTYSANATAADLWMMATYGNHTIAFQDPDEIGKIKYFETEAKQRKLSIGDFPPASNR